MMTDIHGAMSRLKQGEVAHRLLVDDATFERLKEGDIIAVISATKKEKNTEILATVLVEKGVEILAKDSSYFLNTGKRSVLLRLTGKQALNLKFYQDKYEISVSPNLMRDQVNPNPVQLFLHLFESFAGDRRRVRVLLHRRAGRVRARGG